MKKVYGKKVDMSSIKRDLSGICMLIDECRVSADKYDLSGRKKRGECVVCKSKDRNLFLTVYNKYKYYECKKCGALTLDQYPEPLEMYSSDDSENLDIYIDKDIYERRVNMIAKPKVEFVMRIIQDEEKIPLTWLDIGCGGGELLYYLKKKDYGIKGIGLETDRKELAYLKELDIDVYDKFIDTNNLDYEIEDIIRDKDIISFFNVLEHIENPREYINYIYNSMKEGGYLILEVPKHPSLASFANLTSLDNVYRHIIPPIHLQIFSKKSLEMLLEDKYDILASWEFGQGFMDVINNAMLISRTKNCAIYDLISNVQDTIQKSIDEAGLSDQIIIIARRRPDK